MLDYKIYTFLKLCELMNYRKTAEALNMSQPGVTQHIQALESIYECSLFEYNGKTLTKTKDGELLEVYAKSFVYNDTELKGKLKETSVKHIRIGATKTIGEYSLNDSIKNLLKNNKISVELIISNTEELLNKINHFELDFALIEGFFDKSKYSYSTFRKEEMVIMCSLNHRLSGKEVKVEELFNEHLIVRENGSGTRALLENFLHEHNYNIENFTRKSVVNSFNLIEAIVEDGNAISFAYKIIADKNPKLSYFRIKNEKIEHEFNYVGLKNINIEAVFDVLNLNKDTK